MRKKRTTTSKKKLLKRYQRAKRIVTFLSILIVAIVFSFVFVVGPVVLETNAATTTLTLIIHPEGWVEPEPPEIIEEPEEETEIVRGGASALQPGMPLAQAQEKPKTPLIKELGWNKPQIEIEALSTIGGVSLGAPSPGKIIKTTSRVIRGWFRTNIKDALVFIRVSSPIFHISTLNGGGDGYFEWETPELEPGIHTIYIELRSPYDPTIKTSISFTIEILTPEEEIAEEAVEERLPIEVPPGIKEVPEVPKIVLPPGVGLFNLNVRILTKEIFSGEVLETEAEIYKLSPAGKLTVPVIYTIEDSQGNIIFEGKEEVPVTHKTILLKDFKTSPVNGAGEYTLTLRLSRENVIFETQDKFIIKEKAVIKLPKSTIGLTAREIFNFFRGGILALLVILIMFSCLLIKEYLSVRKIQFNGKDLLKNKLIS